MLKISEIGSDSVSFSYRSMEAELFLFEDHEWDEVAFTVSGLHSELSNHHLVKKYRENVKDLRELSKLTGVSILTKTSIEDNEDTDVYFEYVLWVPMRKLIPLLRSEDLTELLFSLHDKVREFGALQVAKVY